MPTSLSVPTLFRRLLLSYVLAVTIEYIFLPTHAKSLASIDEMATMSLVRLAVFTVLVFAVLMRMRLSAVQERWGLLAIAAALCGITLLYAFTLPLLFVCMGIVYLLFVFARRGWNDTPRITQTHIKRPWWRRATIALTAVIFCLLCVWSLSRVYCFGAHTYDFGIFAQMFHSMKTTGLPITTLERDGALSHFAVHFSPIYYLFLPFYCIAPYLTTLQVSAIAVSLSAVIPLWLLGKHHGLTDKQRFLVCAVLLLQPAFVCGMGYDIHENVCLTPLLFWLFYGIDSRRPWVTATAALLTLMVKEDAAVYVAVCGVYGAVCALLHRDKPALFRSGGLFACAVVWFCAVTYCLSVYGNGVMTERYSNFMHDGSQSLTTLLTSVILCPMKAVWECLDTDKLLYIALTLVPLLCIPLFTRRYERYILLIPYILINLMTDYPFQHSVFYQYNYGSIAFLLYLFLLNVADIHASRRQTAVLLASIVVSIPFFGMTTAAGMHRYIADIRTNSETYQQVWAILEQIPDDARVTATSQYTASLSKREVLYDVAHSSKEHILTTDYVLCNTKHLYPYNKYATNDGNGYEHFRMWLEENGYTVYATVEDELVIYRKE